MHNAIENMLKKYTCNNLNDYTNALKEIIQEIALLGLWRAKFFEKAAFYGGTALRILHQLDRFSEDMDFSLLKPDPNFSLTKYTIALQQELASFGFETTVEKKDKLIETTIQSAFIKADTKKQLLYINAPNQLAEFIHHQQKLQIKLEVDIDPPPNFLVETKILLQPIPFSVNLYKLPYLFAGKIHAILCRAWQNRVKGRDWYDFVWYIANNVSLSTEHLLARLIQSGHFSGHTLDAAIIKALLHEKIDHLDIKNAQDDVKLFLKDPASIEIWSKDFFHLLTEKIKC